MRNWFGYILLFYFLTNNYYLLSQDLVIDGYTDKKSYNPGDTIRFHLNSKKTVDIFLPIVNIENKVVDSVNVSLKKQKTTNEVPWLDFDYSVSGTYIIPKDFKSGLYSIFSKVYFIVKSSSKEVDITIVHPTTTDEAYNNSGGKSLYDFNSDSKKRVSSVGFLRPLSELVLGENMSLYKPFLKWYNQSVTNYTTQHISDLDLDNYVEISKSKIVIIIGHSEYWTRQARQNFDLFIKNKKHALVFSGNTMWWQTRYSENKKELVCFKDFNLDPIENMKLKTVNWSDSLLDYKVSSSIGTEWLSGAYGMKIANNRGYKITAPNSPLLKNTDLKNGDILHCESYEIDGLPILKIENKKPFFDTTKLKFYKSEIIGYDFGKSIGYDPKLGYGVFFVFQKNINSGIVINSSFNAFTGATLKSGKGGFGDVDSSKIKQIIINSLNLLISNQSVFSEEKLTASTEEIDFHMNEFIYPNPVTSYLTINNLDFTHFEIYTMAGLVVRSGTIENGRVDDIHLVNGAYLLKVWDRINENTKFYRFMLENK